FGEQAVDRRDGHVAADHVVVDEGEVAALEVVRNAGRAAHGNQLVGRLDGDGEAVFPQVVGITFAAAALRVFVEGYLFFGERVGTEGEIAGDTQHCGGQGGNNGLAHGFSLSVSWFGVR